MSLLDNILPRLSKVRGRRGSYVACCPAHEDRSPSMTIRETPDGKVLMHCFAGCSVDQIAGAIGLELSDLFPEDTKDYATPQRKIKPRFMAHDLLRVVSFEATIVAVCAHEMSEGRPLQARDLDRLRVAVQRINEALEYNA